MNHPEALLLNVLQPGDLARFVVRLDRDRMLDVSIEGAAAGGDEMLRERMEIALSGLRSHGYVFGRTFKGDQDRPDEKQSHWVEIRPGSTLLAVGRAGGLGFGAVQGAPTGANLRLPELLAHHYGFSSESLALQIVSAPEILMLEAEFVRMDLTPEDLPLLEEALSLRSVASRGIGKRVMGESGTPTEAFLSLWILHQSGWRIALRVMIDSNRPAPAVLLGMIGRAFFRCECDVASVALARPAKHTVDLSQCYPREWPFPDVVPGPTSFNTLVARRFHNRSLPRLPKEGLVIGAAEGRRIRLPSASRDRHTYIVGATGTGKSTLLERMIVEDIRRGEGVIVLDPHGDLYHRILASVPAERSHELFCLDPTAGATLPGFNILDLPHTPLRQRQAAFLVGELVRFFHETWNMNVAGGPMFEMYFRNTLLLMCLQQDEGGDAATPAKPLNLGQFARVLCNREFRKYLLKRCPDKSVVDFWTNMAERTTGDSDLANIAPYVASKLNGMVQSGFLAELLCQERNEVRLGQRMDRGEIILINLNKGLLGAYESRLLGTILMMEIFSAGLARGARPESERRPVGVYVDEFQDFVSDNVASMLSEARKFGLRLTLANQTLAQLRSHSGKQDLLETVLGNVGNLIAFRLGVPDADRLKLFLDPFSPAEMQELPNFHAFARILTPEGPIRPLIFQTLRPRNTDRVTEEKPTVTPNSVCAQPETSHRSVPAETTSAGTPATQSVTLSKT